MDELNVNYCFKCGKYGHSKKKCREAKQKCMKCVGDHHIQHCNENNVDRCAYEAANNFIKAKQNFDPQKDKLWSEDHKCGDRNVC